MARLKGACDIRCQAVQAEALRMENRLRMRWFIKNRERLLENLGKAREILSEETPLVIATPLQLENQSAPLPHWRPPASDGSIDLSVMRPVDPRVRALLFEKGVQSSIAAKNYNDKRLKEGPDDRYYYPECSSWIHGWRFRDFPPPLRSSVGLKSTTRTEFYHPRACSIYRNPEWYKEQQRRSVKDLSF